MPPLSEHRCTFKSCKWWMLTGSASRSVVVDRICKQVSSQDARMPGRNSIYRGKLLGKELPFVLLRPMLSAGNASGSSAVVEHARRQPLVLHASAANLPGAMGRQLENCQQHTPKFLNPIAGRSRWLWVGI